MDTDSMVLVTFPEGIFAGLGFRADYKNRAAFEHTVDEAVQAVTKDEDGQVPIGIEWMTNVREA